MDEGLANGQRERDGQADGGSGTREREDKKGNRKRVEGKGRKEIKAKFRV